MQPRVHVDIVHMIYSSKLGKGRLAPHAEAVYRKLASKRMLCTDDH